MIASHKVIDKFEHVMVKCISIDKTDKKVNISEQKFKFSPDSKKIIEETNRLYITPTITDDKIVCYVPMVWDRYAINNYIYALMGEIKLIKSGDKNAKTKDELKKQFTLEVILIQQ